MTRRPLGTGPERPTGIRAAQADLLPDMPAVPMPDLDDMRARGVLGHGPAPQPAPRRALGTGNQA